MVKITITPKTQIPGSFFLDHDNAREYKTSAVTMSSGYLLFWDNERDSACNFKLDFISYFYDIVTA